MNAKKDESIIVLKQIAKSMERITYDRNLTNLYVYSLVYYICHFVRI